MSYGEGEHRSNYVGLLLNEVYTAALLKDVTLPNRLSLTTLAESSISSSSSEKSLNVFCKHIACFGVGCFSLLVCSFVLLRRCWKPKSNSWLNVILPCTLSPGCSVLAYCLRLASSTAPCSFTERVWPSLFQPLPPPHPPVTSLSLAAPLSLEKVHLGTYGTTQDINISLLDKVDPQLHFAIRLPTCLARRHRSEC